MCYDFESTTSARLAGRDQLFEAPIAIEVWNFEINWRFLGYYLANKNFCHSKLSINLDFLGILLSVYVNMDVLKPLSQASGKEPRRFLKPQTELPSLLPLCWFFDVLRTKETDVSVASGYRYRYDISACYVPCNGLSVEINLGIADNHVVHVTPVDIQFFHVLPILSIQDTQQYNTF